MAGFQVFLRGRISVFANITEMAVLAVPWVTRTGMVECGLTAVSNVKDTRTRTLKIQPQDPGDEFFNHVCRICATALKD